MEVSRDAKGLLTNSYLPSKAGVPLLIFCRMQLQMVLHQDKGHGFSKSILTSEQNVGFHRGPEPLLVPHTNTMETR